MQPSYSLPWPRAADVFAATEQVIRSHSKTFYFATALLLRDQRNAIRALYAFCRASDDLVDREEASLADVENWRQEVRRPLYAQDRPELVAWALTRESYAIDLRYEQELLDGISLDVQPRLYADWPALEHYCYLVASTVGLLSLPVIGTAPGVSFEQAAPFAARLGIALQLTNILRDVGEDAAHGRVYLPLADLARFALTPQDILRGVSDERFIALMKFEIARAREIFDQALPGIALLSISARPAVGAAAMLYRDILNEIEKLGYQVFNKRAHTSGLQKLLRLPVILYKILRLRSPLDSGDKSREP
jgi:phytoene synthase